ncbi:hypothetical protein G6F57_015432 [Rhizopus arrhizus]|nr:hypothetical protein G6F22_014476 [Rhizopus arrhizus]KAG1454779.1 hypothetical protein G6F57_015432 [Rhizopus arrhizus]
MDHQRTIRRIGDACTCRRAVLAFRRPPRPSGQCNPVRHHVHVAAIALHRARLGAGFDESQRRVQSARGSVVCQHREGERLDVLRACGGKCPKEQLPGDSVPTMPCAHVDAVNFRRVPP